MVSSCLACVGVTVISEQSYNLSIVLNKYFCYINPPNYIHAFLSNLLLSN